MVGELVGTCHLHCYLGVVLYSILVIGLDGVSVILMDHCHYVSGLIVV